MAYSPRRLVGDTLVVLVFSIIILYQACLVLFSKIQGLFNPDGTLAFDTEKDIPDLDGKVLMITGGNIGLGRETILRLSKRNPSRIYLLARNASKAASAIDEIKTLVPSARITFLQCNLSSFTSVCNCAQEFVSREKRLDVLILNAGVMALPPALTEEGYEIQFGTNHMGHALLTKLLLPVILDTAKMQHDARIIVLSSIAHLGCFRGISYASLKTTMSSTWTLLRYCQSKLANVLFARALSNRYGKRGITALSIHPGMVETPIYDTYFKEFGVVGRVAHWIKRLLWISIEDGAKGTLWAVGTGLESELKSRGKRVKNGAYYGSVGQEGGASRQACSDEAADELWEWTMKELDGWNLDER